SLAAVAVHISCRNGGRGFALRIIAIVQVRTVHGLFQTFCGWTTYRRSSMSYCRYGVQLSTEKTSGKSGPQNENYAEVYTIQSCRKKNLKLSIKHDHDYIYVCDCVENGSCSGCFKKQKVIDRLQLELEGLKTENALLRRQATKGRNVVDKFLKTDAKIRTYTGLPNKKTFNNLVKYVTQKSKKLRYWSGSKKAISTKVRRNFKTSPKKTGPQRKLSVKEELTLVLL
ncbi:unnamed protein product, partial [Porites lobata]